MSHTSDTQTYTFLPCLKFSSGASGGLEPLWTSGAALPILWRHGLENKREKGWNDAPGTPQALGELGPGCQFADEAKRPWVKLGPSCRAHQSLRKSKTALGDVLIRPAHKNTELWPLKPFLFLDFSHSLLSAAFGRLRPACAAVSPQSSWARALSHPSSQPSLDSLGMFSRMLNSQISAVI